MSAGALRRAAAAVLGPSEEQLDELGHEVERVVASTLRRLEELDRAPATLAQVLGVKPIEVGIDFEKLDELAKQVSRVLDRDPAATFWMHGETQSFAAWHDQLRAAIEVSAPYRRSGRPS